MSPIPGPRLAYLDRLRGMAVCGVVLVHCGQAVDHLPTAVKAMTGYCAHGVQLFFTVSALTLSVVSEPKETKWRNFYVRRFFRVAPMFYLAAVAYLFLRGRDAQYFAPHGIGWHQILLTFLFMHGLRFDSINSVVPGGWSIANEAIFYLMFPALVALTTSFKRAAALSVATVFLSYFHDRVVGAFFSGYEPHYLVLEYLNYSFFDNATAFAMGLLAFQAFRETPLAESMSLGGTLREGLRARVRIISAVTWICILACAVSGNETLRSLLVAEILIFLLVIAARLRNPVSSGSDNLLGRLGVISFSVYLIHFEVLDLVKGLVPAEIAPVFRLLALFGGVISFSSGLAMITYRWIESPMNSLGRRLTSQP